VGVAVFDRFFVTGNFGLTGAHHPFPQVA